MNDRQLLDQLDQRATKAATDLRSRAQSRPRPGFDADAPQVLTLRRVADKSNRRPTRVLAVAAVIIVLAAVVAVGIVVTRRSSPSDQRPAGDPDLTEVKSVAPRPYVATDLPKGFKVAGAAESPPDDESPGSTNESAQLSTLFGPADDDPRIAVTIGPSIPPTAKGAETIEVDGQTLYAVEMGPTTLVAKRRIDQSVLVLGKGIDRQTLGRFALAVRVAGSPPNLLPKDLPDGWRKLGRTFLGDGITSLRPPSVSGALGPAYLAVYSRSGVLGDNGGLPITVTVRRGDEATLNAARLRDGKVERTVVRGHPALLVTRGESNLRLRELFWLERPGELIEVAAGDLSLDSLRRVAEGLRPAGASEWRRLLELDSPAPSSPAPSGLKDIAMGTFADGTTWAMQVQMQLPDANPVATIRLGLDGPLSSMFGPRDGSKVILSSGDYEQEGRSFSYGLVGGNVASVALVGDDGHWIDAIPVAGSGYRGWLVEFTDFVDRKPLIVAYDAAGRELEHMPAKRLANYGSPTATVPTTVPQPGN